MRVNNSLEWAHISVPLRDQMLAAPPQTRIDLSRLLGNVTELIAALSSEEVELRRNRKKSSPKQQELLVKIEENLDLFEQWLVIAHLSYG